ncbi:hypothetical protein GCM10009765_15960 [Fodinicola feengrottensis]|uniref:Uncharacterized protein n=2 Tax=Fodinicola feengrottensis TaxID=435914 RepID=A0ABP4S4S7_9ACTN
MGMSRTNRWARSLPLAGVVTLAVVLTGCGQAAPGKAAPGKAAGPAAIVQPAWCGPANNAFNDQDGFAKTVTSSKKVTPDQVAKAKSDDKAFLAAAPADAKADVTILTTQFDQQADSMLNGSNLQLPKSYLDTVTRFRTYSANHNCHLGYSDDNG